MANINLSEAFAVARFGPFGGINAQPKDREGCILSDIKNFRITESGTLEKRSGFSELLSLPGVPRAIAAVSEYEMFVLIGGQIYLSSLLNQTNTSVSTVSGSFGDASFFKFGGDIYLLDGYEIYRYNGSTFTPVEGYVPLYFKDASPSSPAQIHEPLNLLSSRYRVSFKLGDTYHEKLSLPFAAASIDRVLRNGVDADVAEYFLELGGEYIDVTSSSLQPNDRVEFYLTMDIHPLERDPLLSCARAVTFGTGKNSHAASSVAFYRGLDQKKIFTTRPVSSSDYLNVKNTYSDVSTLYVTEEDAATLDGDITAASPCGSSLAVFLDGSAYLAEENSGFGTKLTCMSRAHGCSVNDGVITFESLPVTMSDSGIFLWRPHDTYDGEYTAECISIPVCHLLPTHIAGGFIYYHRSKNEIWCQPSNTEILVRNTLTDDWYTFEGFFPRFIFEMKGRTVFVTNNTLYGFSESDVTDAGRAIEVSISARRISFGDLNRKKKLARAIILCAKDSKFDLTVTDSNGSVVDLTLTCDGSEMMGYIEKRLPTKRARYYSLNLSAKGIDKTTIDSLILTAVK